MGKTSKWIKHLFLASNNKDKRESKFNSLRGTTEENPTTTPVSVLPSTPKEKRRWSFRRSSAKAPLEPMVELENEHKRHTLAVVAATSAAADAAVAAAQAAVVVMQLTGTAVESRRRRGNEETAAMKIQSVFRGYLARKALGALRGLVKLQALVRGHLVRKQTAATLRCMQALVTVQARARMHRIKINNDYSLDQIPTNIHNQRLLNHRYSTQENRFRPTYNEMDLGMEENIKIVEMDYGDSRTIRQGRDTYSYEPTDDRFLTQTVANCIYSSKPHQRDISPAPSAMSVFTEIMTPKSYSNHFEEYYMNTAQSSPQCYTTIAKPQEYSEYGPVPFDYTLNPSYMANTQSSRAKARSQSAPRSRSDNTNPPFERQTSKRRPSIEGRNVPKAVRMQRSSSQAECNIAQNNYHYYPWSIKLDKSSVSFKDSECGSTSTVLTNTQYCRSLVGFEV